MSEKREAWTNRFGQILESKKGDLYIKIDKDAVLNAGDVIFMKSQVDNLAGMLGNGAIDQDRHDELLEKTSFVKYVLDLPPSKE